jgi:hypothetical protein
MGNTEIKPDKGFFEEIKNIITYREFAIKMNQLIVRSNVNWELLFESIVTVDLPIHETTFKFFFIFSVDYIYELTFKKIAKDKEDFKMVSPFLNILRNLLVYMSKNNSIWLYDMIWKRVNNNIVLEPVLTDKLTIKGVKVDLKGYIGSEEQFPIGLKLLVSVNELLFKNNFSVEYNKEDKAKLASCIMQKGWNDTSDQSVITNRVRLLEFLIDFIMVDQELNVLNSKVCSTVLSYFKHSNNYDILLRSFLKTSSEYKENGLIPYSSFLFYKKLDRQIELSSLSFCLLLLFLNEESKLSTSNFKDSLAYLPSYLINLQIENAQIEKESNLNSIFLDEPFIQRVLESLSDNVISLYIQNKSVLPNSYKEVS